MSERSALRHLTDAKAERLFLQDYHCDGYVLYREADQSYAVVVMGRVRHFSAEQMMTLLSAPDSPPSEAAQ